MTDGLGRRLRVAAAFAAVVTIQFTAGPLIEGRGAGWAPIAGLAALGLVLGFVMFPQFEATVGMSAPALPERERVRRTAVWIGTTGASLLIGMALVRGSVDRAEVLQVGLVLGALFLFVAGLPRLVGTSSLPVGRGPIVLHRSARRTGGA